MATQEKIVFFIDLSEEMNRIIANGTTKLELVKRSITLYLHTKNFMNKAHQFAIAVLTEAAIWVQEFSSNIGLVQDKLVDLHTQGTFSQFGMVKKK